MSVSEEMTDVTAVLGNLRTNLVKRIESEKESAFQAGKKAWGRRDASCAVSSVEPKGGLS
jgi:hypothetical protein